MSDINAQSYASPHPTPVAIGVIGGSGVSNLQCLEDRTYYDVDTPFGKPSGPVCVATIQASAADPTRIPCAFIARHGVHHSHNPSEVNYRANICALKILGVEYILAINAVGSLHEDYKPGDLVVVDQLIDRTVRRESTFFSGIGVVAHVDFAFPMSLALSAVVFQTLCATFPKAKRAAGENHKVLGKTVESVLASVPAAESAAAPKIGEDVSNDFTIHASGTLVVMEGPQFSTRAESLSNKNALGGHLIGMTSCPEAKLAREAEISYCTVAMVTDNDAWQHAAPHVDVASVMKVVKANGAKAQVYPPAILRALASQLSGSSNCGDGKKALEEDSAHSAAQYAIMTHPEHISAHAKAMLRPLFGKKYPTFA